MYPSKKLLSTGFRYRLGVEGAVRSIAASHVTGLGTVERLSSRQQ